MCISKHFKAQWLLYVLPGLTFKAHWLLYVLPGLTFKAQWLLYVLPGLTFKAQWLLYVLPGLTFKNSTFCPQNALMCFLRSSEKQLIFHSTEITC
jgi:hypothetical protein